MKSERTQIRSAFKYLAIKIHHVKRKLTKKGTEQNEGLNNMKIKITLKLYTIMLVLVSRRILCFVIL